MEKIKRNHILRLQKNECTIELGFVLNDMLINFERVSDHCSNVAGCLLEMSQHGTMDMHKFLQDIRESNSAYEALYKEYTAKYTM